MNGKKQAAVDLPVIDSLTAHYNYTAITARMLARIAHASQLDKFNGEPYILHLERVAERVQDAEAKIVAWLHDIIEDTPVTEEFLCRMFSARVVAAVSLLTRDRGFTYAQYIANLRASGNRLAIAVKIADLEDHLRPQSHAIPESMRERYTRALETLRGQSS